jgi:uncharacterized protein (DUF2336 family)
MAKPNLFLADLEDAVSRGTAEGCLRALWHATDVLVSGTYSEDQIWTFGEIIARLAEEIELGARIQLAKKLAPSKNAPLKIIKRLASDDWIEVAGPVLEQSERLDVDTLMAVARDKGQQHLLAISSRKSIPEQVTDILVVRGGRMVVAAVAANRGAHFSDSGFLHLVRRSEGNSVLAESIGLREDIPRHLFQQLISRASEQVRTKLLQERPDMEGQINGIVTDVADTIHARLGPASKDYVIAIRTVAKLHQRGELTEDEVFEFARGLKFSETVAALSLLCSLPNDIVERALVDKNRESILIVAKALDFSWTTAMALLFLGAPNYRITAGDLDRMKIDFIRLKYETCLRVLDVYRTRKGTAEPDSGPFSPRYPN